MKKIIVLVALLALCGCNEVQQLATDVQRLNVAIDDYQKITTELVVKMKVNEAEVVKANAEIDRVQSHVAVVAEAVAKAEYTGDVPTDGLRAVHAGSTAASPFVPYAGVISIITGALLAFVEAKRQSERKARKYAEGELNRKNNSS